jgi:FkbM family methyltransferase
MIQPFTFSPTCQITGLENIYNKYFSEGPLGTFVEIGAFDGETHSNTSGLADSGWRGIYVEPISEYAELCIKRHDANDVEVIQALVGDKVGYERISLAGELSTVVEDAEKMYGQAGLAELYKIEDKKSFRYIIQFTLNDIMNMAHVHKNYNLLVLDCEGAEWPVLSVYDISYWKPKMVIVEMHEQSSEWQSIAAIKQDTDRINDYMKSNGYSQIHSDEINTIFIRNDIKK